MILHLNIILRFIKKAFLIFFLAYIGLGIMLFVFQEKYIYYPDTTDFQNCPAFQNAEKVSFGSGRGYLTKRSPEMIIVYYHGNAGRACDRAYLDSFFAEQGHSTFFVEYSGYGEKENKPSMAGLLGNVTDTIGFLETQEFKTIVVIGESVGAGPAAYHTVHANIANLILITAYTNLADVASSYYPVYPMRLLLRNNFTPDAWLADYKGSVSVILAEHDEVIPNALGKKLFEGLSSDVKEIYSIKNAGHNTLYEKEEFFDAVKKALEEDKVSPD